ncbi:MAG: dihydrofolate reductase [Planctomycetota bacterium]|nr:dihydrofolate reductase [Planctomycetota bacterium]
MSLSIIVAAATNNVIGRNDSLPWRLSSDLRRFKSLTMGHHLIMGRKTFDSISRLLPGRKTIIMTRSQEFQIEGALIANTLSQAIEQAKSDPECFVVGGAEIYKQAIPLAQKIYLTRVNQAVTGDTYLPEIPWEQFEMTSAENIPADEKNEYATTFQVYQKKAVAP